MMKQIEELATQFQPITLAEMGGIKLMNRTDTKFLASTQQLAALLRMAQGDYRAQDIDGQRLMNYGTLYFDTPDYTFYTLHHDGHAGRQKVRIRSYMDSGLSFLEVKTKDNHGRTHKKRTATPTLASAPEARAFNSEEQRRFLTRHLSTAEASLLTGKIGNRFKRITLVNSAKTERLTIDTELTFNNLTTGRSARLDGLAIIELKRDGHVASPVLDLLWKLRIHPSGFSKYCLGLAMTDPTLRQNRFKKRIHDVTRIAPIKHQGQNHN